MIATPISDSPAISPLDTGTVQVIDKRNPAAHSVTMPAGVTYGSVVNVTALTRSRRIHRPRGRPGALGWFFVWRRIVVTACHRVDSRI